MVAGSGTEDDTEALRQRIAELERLIGEYVLIADSLRAGERHLSLLYDSSPVAYHSLDATGHLLDVNPAWIDLLGYPRDEVIGHWLGDFMTEASRQRFGAGFAAFVEAGGMRDARYELRSHDGSTINVAIDGRLGHDTDGEFDRTHCIVHDLTERARSEAALHAEREKAQQYLDIAGVILVAIDADETIQMINRKGCELLGRTAEQLVGGNWFDIAIPAAERERVRAMFRETMKGHGELTTYYENQILAAGDELRYISWHNTVQRAPDGRTLATLSSGQDITERKEAEARERKHVRGLALLAESAMDFAQFPPSGDIDRFIADRLFELVGGGVVVVTRFVEDTGELSIQAIAGATGDIEERVGTTFAIDPTMATSYLEGRMLRLAPRLDELTGGAIPVDDARRIERDLELDQVYALGTARAGRLLGSMAILTPRGLAVDVSLIEAFAGQAATALARRRTEAEKADLEARLLQSQKMEAIGTLAGGIAHDFNNLLTGIIGQTWVLKRQVDASGAVQRGLEAIETAAMRAAELTKQLLGFARRGKLENVTVDLHQVIDDVISVLRHALDKRIIVITATEEAKPLVAGDPAQLQQVLLNLAVNARDAMPEGGMLTFETRRVVRDERPGEFLRVSVTDTGAGIPDSIRPRIFEPFFTTKPRDQGTGLGLAMVYGIIRNHDGWIEVDSRADGTRFDVFLPISPDEAATRWLPLPTEPLTGEGSILLVDDEPTVREVVNQILPPLGYQVAYASNGQEAVDYYRAHLGEIDLVLLDLVMPVMNGTSCFRALKALDPDVCALLVSGHGIDGVADDLIAEGLLGFLAKPFTPSTLSQAVAGALAEARERH